MRTFILRNRALKIMVDFLNERKMVFLRKKILALFLMIDFKCK